METIPCFRREFVQYSMNGSSVKCLMSASKCSRFVGCGGQKEVACPSCNPNKDLRFAVSGVTTECSRCYGRGLLAHLDGSDTKLVSDRILVDLRLHLVLILMIFFLFIFACYKPRFALHVR